MPRLKLQKGQTTVEFALILPIFFTIMFLIIQFGMLFFCWFSVTQAAREGVRSAAVGVSYGAVEGNLRRGIQGDRLQFTWDTAEGALAVGEPVGLRVTLPTTGIVIFPEFSSYFPATISGYAVMRVENL